jgi:hypothetical protein
MTSRGTRLFLLFTLVACQTATPARTAQPESVAREERLIEGSAVYDKHPLFSPIDPEGEEEDFFASYQFYQEHFGRDAGVRLLQAYRELQEMRRARGLRHVGTGFAEKSDAIRGKLVPVPNAPGTTDPNGCAWISAGPTNINGRVTSIAIDPNNRNRVYVTSVGGIWRSFDAARRWQRVSDDFLATVFGSIAVNPTTPNEIIAGGGDSSYGNQNRGGIGIWRSTNFGAPGSWTKVSPPELEKKVIYRLRYDPAAPNDLYVAASNGVWLGVHSGGNMTFTRLGNFDAWTSDMVVDFSVSPRKVYAGVKSGSVNFPVKGIYKWNGLSWQKKDSGIPTADSDTIALALAKTNPAILFAKIAQLSDGKLQGVYKTTVAGEGMNAWSPLPGAAPLNDSCSNVFCYNWYNSVIEIDPTDANIVFAAGLSPWRSTNGGGSWTKIAGGADPSFTYFTHADGHAFAFDPVNPKIVYAGNDGGLDKTTDMSAATWHWNDVSHGMVMTELYAMGSEREHPSLLAGGSQDNGTEVSFGNRTWYNPGGCDGHETAFDAKNPDTLYARCNQVLFELSNPVPGTAGGQSQVAWVSPAPLYSPLITDALFAGGALSAGGTKCGLQTVLKTTDGVNWTPTNTNFLEGAKAIALASAPSAAFQIYMAAVAYRPPSLKDCPGFSGFPFPSTIYRSENGGTSWTANASGLPNASPSSVVFDHTNPNRGYATYGLGSGAIYMTTDTFVWNSIIGSGPTGLPPSAGIWKVVADPSDPNVLYVATDVGVFRGVITLGAPPTAVWMPFDEGLPDGLMVFDVWIDPGTGILSLASYGHGAYRRDIRANVQCPARMLVVRDNVYDVGVEPSPYAIPDAEHPVPDPARPMFYKPDDSWGGRTYWWSSTDIRIDVPSADPPANQIGNADHVEFEICPTAISKCPAGTMIDSPPAAGKPARVYVQVANHGVQPVLNARAITIWTAPSAALPPLPPTFWSTTFPSGGPCGALDQSTGWHLVDPLTPCRTIGVINPELPELMRWDWNVPMSVNGHACMLTVVESADDPLDPTIRALNKVKPEDIVASSRHIAQRNLTILPFKLFPIKLMPVLSPLQIINTTERDGIELVISKTDLRGGVLIVLPPGLKARPASDGVRQTEVGSDFIEEVRKMGLDPANAWEFRGSDDVLSLALVAGQRTGIAVIAAPSDARASSRFSVVERQGEHPLGGNVFLFRPEEQR